MDAPFNMNKTKKKWRQKKIVFLLKQVLFFYEHQARY